MSKEQAIITLLEKTMRKNDFDPKSIKEDDYHLEMAKKRFQGEKFTLSDYVEGLLWSQLSAQRVWSYLVKKAELVDDIFAQYDYERTLTLAKNPKKLVEKLTSIKAGNRMIHKQMDALADNLKQLKKIHNLIEYEYLSNLTRLEKTMLGEKYIKEISKSYNQYKLKQVGPALAGEFLKNIGIPVVKMDTHLLRILGQKRLGIISCQDENATTKIKQKAIKEFHQFAKRYSTDISDIIYLDVLFWTFCAKGEENLNICAKKPQCEKCLLGDFCNY